MCRKEVGSLSYDFGDGRRAELEVGFILWGGRWCLISQAHLELASLAADTFPYLFHHFKFWQIPCVPSQDQDFFAALTAITRVQIYFIAAFLQTVTFRSQYSTRCASCFPLSCFRSYPPIPEFLNFCLTDQSFFGSSMKVNTQNGGISLSRLRATSEPAVSVLLCRCTLLFAVQQKVHTPFGH